MITVLCPPIEDSGPNQYLPTPAQAHYLCVDEDPNDGDTSQLATAVGREVWRLDVSAIPEGSRIVAVRIRTAQKQTTAGSQSFQIGFIIGAQDFFVASHNLTSGSAYLIFDDNVGPDPSDGADWTKDRLARAYLCHNETGQPQGLPRPRLSECVVFADIIPPVSRAGATGEPLATTGSGSSLAGSAAAAAASPRAAAQSRAATVAGSSRASAAAGASLRASGAGASRAPRAVSIVSPSGLRVTAQSLAPDVAGVGLGGSVSAQTLEAT